MLPVTFIRQKNMRKSIIFALAVLSLTACTNRPIDTFAWNKATVYFVLVDRFCNGDSTNMAHYQKLCAFRKNHPAVGAGKQTVLNATTVIRALGNDTIFIALNPQAGQTIPVPFAEGAQVRNAYSGETSTVQNGQVLLQQSCGHVALIERKN